MLLANFLIYGESVSSLPEKISRMIEMEAGEYQASYRFSQGIRILREKNCHAVVQKTVVDVSNETVG